MSERARLQNAFVGSRRSSVNPASVCSLCSAAPSGLTLVPSSPRPWLDTHDARYVLEQLQPPSTVRYI